MASPAPTCLAALSEATRLWPGRNRASDGILGDQSHQKRKSDHNEGNAFDLTHDPVHGCDAHALMEALKQRRDPRVKYIISNARIWNPHVAPGWRPYSGANPHTKHAHVSILAGARGNTAPWWGDQPRPEPVPTTGGQERDRIAQLQRLVGAAADGVWGPKTAAACGRHMVGWPQHVRAHAPRLADQLHGNANRELVRWLQVQGNRRLGGGLVEDGLVGPQTNHLIVVNLGQADGVCGPNGFREAVR